MSRFTPEPPASDEILAQVGYDPMSIPDMKEPEVVEYLRGITTYVSARAVRRAVKAGQIKGVRRMGCRFYSRRAALDWLMTGDESEPVES